MIFRKKFNEANEIGKLCREITERYDNQYIDMTIKSVGRVHCHTNVARVHCSTSVADECEMTAHLNSIEFSVDIDFDVDFENQEDEEEMFRRIAKTKPFNELEVVVYYDESWDD